ncbi:MAG: peptide chain release factor N(5)-glutamine methyltransferase [Planctomycetaceae bacterium]
MNTAPQKPSSDEWTVQKVLDWSIGYLRENGSDSPRLDAEILLAHSCGWERIHLYTNYDKPLSPDQRGRMRDFIQRRAKAEPVAYLVGFREFFGLDFSVNSAVLIPRPDTETLVRTALDVLKERSTSNVLDIGTGSGCVAVAIAVNCPGANVTAVDISPEALAIASVNADKHNMSDRIRLLQSDVFSGVPDEKFEVIVSNPPYIRADEMPGLDADVRDHEPTGALVGGTDGLDIVRQIIAQSPGYLTDDGHLMLEVDGQQAEPVAELLKRAGFQNVGIEKDLSGIQRVVYGNRSQG